MRLTEGHPSGNGAPASRFRNAGWAVAAVHPALMPAAAVQIVTQGLGRSWCAKGTWVEGRRSSSVAPSATGDFWVCVRRCWRERISLEQTKTKLNTGHWKDSGGWRCASDILCRHGNQCKSKQKPRCTWREVRSRRKVPLPSSVTKAPRSASQPLSPSGAWGLKNIENAFPVHMRLHEAPRIHFLLLERGAWTV